MSGRRRIRSRDAPAPGFGSEGTFQRGPSLRPSGSVRPSRAPAVVSGRLSTDGSTEGRGGHGVGLAERRRDEVLPEGMGQASGVVGHDDQRIAAGEPVAWCSASSRGPAPPPWETMGRCPSSGRSCPAGSRSDLAASQIGTSSSRTGMPIRSAQRNTPDAPPVPSSRRSR